MEWRESSNSTNIYTEVARADENELRVNIPDPNLVREIYLTFTYILCNELELRSDSSGLALA